MYVAVAETDRLYSMTGGGVGGSDSRATAQSTADMVNLRSFAEVSEGGGRSAPSVAARLRLPFVPAVRKVRAAQPQKDMENSWQQAHNLDGAFHIDPWEGMAGPVLLLDDLVDSGWTLTVVAALLRQEGGGPVTPFALAANR
jgi:adenine/guanine phosphoribosyltransferase-like PRPP-binding protein